MDILLIIFEERWSRIELFADTLSYKFRLIDTAGIRRRAVVASSGSMTEALSVNRAFRAIRRSDVVALVIEALACITEQDCKIAERIEREGKGCLIVVNKWDTIPNKNQQTATYYEEDVREKLRILGWAPIVYSTAIAGQSVDKIIDAASTVEKERSRRLSTSVVNQVVQEALAFKSPPRTRGGKRGRIYYCTQAAIRPPTFVFFVNDAKLFPETYRRYMEKQLRSDAGFLGTPIRLLWSNRRKTEKEEGRAATRAQANLVPHSRLEPNTSIRYVQKARAKPESCCFSSPVLSCYFNGRAKLDGFACTDLRPRKDANKQYCIRTDHQGHYNFKIAWESFATGTTVSGYLLHSVFNCYQELARIHHRVHANLVLFSPIPEFNP
ncbi:hypothetical protein C1H46_022233 [Malus baccata]|uniref:GTPase Der C-terminal KH-domain-like domain-containing protein n=1 Tax=Malus baccata TaxID=106549 RepID=A0A540M0B7_MALBA|nr:hypothetical protein C1H46_022233 [Malus baccata]